MAHPLSLSAQRANASALTTALVGALLGGGVAAADGGYFPETWAWVAALTFVPAAVILIVGAHARLGRLDLVFLGLLLAFGCWTLLSAWWSPSPTSAVFEAQRILAYLGVALLVLLIVERRTAPLLLGGCLAGVTLVAGYALLTRLLPGGLATFELDLGLPPVRSDRLLERPRHLRGDGRAARRRLPRPRPECGGANRRGGAARRAGDDALLHLQPGILGRRSRPALRSPSHSMLRGCGCSLPSLVVAPWCVIAVWLASRSDALTTRGSTLADARSQGHALLLAVAALDPRLGSGRPGAGTRSIAVSG